jgi:hypothetical protein
MDPDLTLGVWLNELLPTLPHQQSSRRHPLRPIPQPKSKPITSIQSSDPKSQRKSPTCGVRKKMADHNIRAEGKRGRGRPRGSRGRVGRGGSTVRNFGIDGAEDTHDGVASGEDGPAGAPRALAIRSVPPLSTSSKESSTRSRTQNKAPSVVVKKEQLALMTPAIRFIDHMEATQRGGLPPMVSRLWKDHLYPALTQPDYVPAGLKVGFYLRHTAGTLFFRDLINWLSVRSV